MENREGMVTVKGAMEILGVSRTPIERLVRQGILHRYTYTIGGRRIYFKREEVEALTKMVEYPLRETK